jgi:hypothetical protein
MAGIGFSHFSIKTAPSGRYFCKTCRLMTFITKVLNFSIKSIPLFNTFVRNNDRKYAEYNCRYSSSSYYNLFCIKLWISLYSGTETYFKGKTGAHIFDGQDFSSNTIGNGIVLPWEKAAEYNQIPLSQKLVGHLNTTKSVSFLVIKDGKLL